MISKILSVVNFIAITILFIMVFTKNNKENFTDAPTGYTNLLVSDPDGNLDTFSLTALENDINTKISDALKLYTTTTDLKANYQPKGNYQPTGNYQPKGNYQPVGNYALKNDLDNYALKNDLDNYVKFGDQHTISSTVDHWAHLYADGTGNKSVKVNHNNSDWGIKGTETKPNNALGFVINKTPKNWK